ncbi:putative mitochondrial protein [Vitis vinifera]|uniref:Putative mitochondrial protein n=1 Tax=Vitis vinifera TaxID=29760 RepID=A0A438HCG9_VITVI|nr:putative mitochondrial protein [Vitis vinifera]
MPNWIRDSGGRLVKRDTPHNKELELSLNIMEATPEDQHSHQGRQDNLNEYRSMRDRMHPPRMSAPSCIVPPTEQLVIRPYLVPLLPTFHGMESENPYAHIKEFEDVCNTFQEGGASIDLMRLKLFPFTLKDKAKIWLNSLRPRSIHTWTDLQAEFLKKFFPTHRTNGLKRQISNFSTKENEKFYECWERYMEAINACPHHGFDTWLLVSYFYDGMSSSMKQLLETMCGGDFMSKNPEEAMDFLSYVAEVSRGWDEPTKGEVGKMKPQLSKVCSCNKKIGGAGTEKKVHEVQAVAEAPVQVKLCPNCQSYEHLVEECPTISAEREMFGDQANVVGQFKSNNNAPYGNTYNSSWRNHPNFSWKARATQHQQPDQPSQQSSSLEQAIANLSKVVGDLLETKKPSMLNSVKELTELTNLNTVQEKGRFPSQPHQNPKGVHEVESLEGESSQMKDVKALITLRSGKKIEKPTPKPHVEKEEETKKGEEMEDKKREISEKKEDYDSTMKAIPKKELQKEEMLKKSTSPPFPQALHGKKGIRNASEILEVLRQVKVNIPLLDMIKQVPTYAKFLKDLRTIKRGLTVNKKAFLTEQVSAILQCKSPLKYKDPGSPTISVMIGGKVVEKALLDLGASVNLLPYFVYKQLGLDPTVKEANLVPIILGRPFLATSNAIFNCRNELMQLTFGNMTLDLNIFYMSKKQTTPEEEESPEEVCIMTLYLSEPPNVLATLQSWRRIEEILPLFNKEEEVAAEKETPKLNLKPLPVELKYTYLEENNQCPVVISSSLTNHQEKCLLEVLKRCKKAIGWQISDLKGISPLVCTHHIYMEEEAKPIRQLQRRLNPHLQEVVRAEVLKLLQAVIICPISDSPWVSSTKWYQRSQGLLWFRMKKEKKLLHASLQVGGWCIDYRKLNAVTRKDHFPLPFIDQVWKESLAIRSIVFWTGIQGVVLGQREDGKPYVIYYASKTLNEAQRNYTTTEKELLAVQDAKAKLIRWILLLQEFDLQIKDKKGVENVVADHLSSYCVKFQVSGMHMTGNISLQKFNAYYWEEPFLFKYCEDQIIRKCVPEDEQQGILNHCHRECMWRPLCLSKAAMKCCNQGFTWPSLFKDAHIMCRSCDRCQRLGKLTKRNQMPMNPILIVELFDVWALTSWDLSQCLW